MRELVEHSIIPISVGADILELNSVICSRSQVQLTFEYWSLHSGQQAPWKIWRHIDLHTFKKV